MTIADEIKRLLTSHQVAERYGFEPNRVGFIQCPFHQGDHTASLKLYDGERGWCCHACHKGGSVIDFVMQLFDLTFSQAIVRLSADFNLGLTQDRITPAQASKILTERRAEADRREQMRLEYNAMAAEHQYWHEVTLYFAPTPLCAESGYIHPLYAEALKRLPYIEYWLDENLGR